MSDKKNKIVLFFPKPFMGEYLTEQRPPLSLLSVSAPLDQKGYQVIIIDGLIAPNYKERALEECQDAICFGVSSMIGYQMVHGADVAKAVRVKYPNLPIVWGGWGPSVKPALFLDKSFGDISVRNQGEETFLELVEAFQDGRPIDHIAGITFKRGADVVTNPNRPVINLNDLPPMPYHLVDMEKYIQSDPYNRGQYLISISSNKPRRDMEIRNLWYYSSWGCSEDCTFCCCPGVAMRRWNAIEPERVCEEVASLVEKRHFNFITFAENLFFVSKDRVRKICEGFIERGLNLHWAATGHARILSKVDDSLLDLMARSGCYAIGMGIESAFPETLSVLHKRLTSEDTWTSVDRLISRNIIPKLSYIVGIPGEPPESVNETIEECCKLKDKYRQRVDISILFFLPLPGAALYKEALKHGYKEPRTFEEWGINTIDKPSFRWLTEAQITTVKRYIDYFEWGYTRELTRKRMRLYETILKRAAMLRVRHRQTSFPIEFWLYDLGRRMKSVLLKGAYSHS